MCWRAMGVRPELARGAIRLSLGWASGEADVERFAEAFRSVIARLRAARARRRVRGEANLKSRRVGARLDVWPGGHRRGFRRPQFSLVFAGLDRFLAELLRPGGRRVMDGVGPHAFDGLARYRRPRRRDREHRPDADRRRARGPRGQAAHSHAQLCLRDGSGCHPRRAGVFRRADDPCADRARSRPRRRARIQHPRELRAVAAFHRAPPIAFGDRGRRRL